MEMYRKSAELKVKAVQEYVLDLLDNKVKVSVAAAAEAGL